MHLPKPFFKLPRCFDVARLREEVAAIPPEAWVAHPNGIAGNSSVRLISVDGEENDLVDGIMRETVHLSHAPYIRQVLASFGVPWSRTRLLRLAPNATVPAHADINYHWFYRVRLHIPVATRPEVRFHCAGTSVHMAPGEAWIFDNWRLHHVLNPTPDARIHLVADTAGNAAFWHLVGSDNDGQLPLKLTYEPGSNPTLLTERSALRPIMNPAELELLVGNLRGELVASPDTSDAQQRLSRYHSLLDSFVRDWRQFYVLHGEDPSGWRDFRRLRDALRSASRPMSEAIVLRTNNVAAHQVLEGRVLRVCVGANVAEMAAVGAPTHRAGVARAADRACLRRPTFIVAAPRSGSTLLFETIAASEQIATLGGEAHWLIETIAELCPGAPGIGSNRLLAEQATPHIIERIQTQILERLVDREGKPLRDARVLKFLEKTPKNALRIPFLNCVFPDSQFVFLWREPRGNISSIIEAWRAGKWQTYPYLEGFALPWSLLLPPGWENMRGKTLAEVAAFQWDVTNRIVLDDLAALGAERWTIIDYDSLVQNPMETIQTVCRISGIKLDTALQKRLCPPLPQAKYTLSAPDPHKWKLNEFAIEPLLPIVESTWHRLQGAGRLHADRSPGHSPKR